MVKLISGSERMKHLEALQRQKEEKEKELKELEVQKQEEIKNVEKKLEAAVADMMSSREEEQESSEEQALEEFEHIQEELDSLEQTIQEEQRHIEQGQAGPIYEIEKEEIQHLDELYGQVKAELDAGRGDSPVVQQAMDMIYHLNREEDVYVATDVRTMLSQDEEGGQYMNRLRSLFDMSEERSGMYRG
ncbi:hypothetical protein ACFL1B_03400 [Nanoarchaeota archaeon]